MSPLMPEIPVSSDWVIDQVFQHSRVELFFTHQIDQNTRVEIATSGARCELSSSLCGGYNQ
jgi:hypothetical protein